MTHNSNTHSGSWLWQQVKDQESRSCCCVFCFRELAAVHFLVEGKSRLPTARWDPTAWMRVALLVAGAWGQNAVQARANDVKCWDVYEHHNFETTLSVALPRIMVVGANRTAVTIRKNQIPFLLHGGSNRKRLKNGSLR